MGALFFLVLTPIGWVKRRAGHDPLWRRFEPAVELLDPPRRVRRALDPCLTSGQRGEARQQAWFRDQNPAIRTSFAARWTRLLGRFDAS
ncbi:MAG TPA: hypothetical protein VFQ82_02695, partial [Stellaceae bacterium]|nr:hypothetical protein [Stellaceae bacterium]